MQQPPNQYPQYPQQQWQPLPEQYQWPLPSQPLTPQQQTNYAQPQSYYPPPPTPPQQQQPQINNPQQPPTKAPTRRSSPRPAWQWILVGLIIGIFIGYAVHVPSSQSSPDSTTATSQDTPQATSQPTQVPTPTHPAATPTPTHTPKWTTVQTITGNGNKKTAIFTAPDDWKIIWSCTGFNDGSGVDGAFSVNVYNADRTSADLSAVDASCKAGSARTTCDTEEHQGGSVYLDIGAPGDWTIQVQELK
jgi:hypothetical protein